MRMLAVFCIVVAGMTAASAQDSIELARAAARLGDGRIEDPAPWRALLGRCKSSAERGMVLTWMGRVGARELAPTVIEALAALPEADRRAASTALAWGELDAWPLDQSEKFGLGARSQAWIVGQSTRPYAWKADVPDAGDAADPRQIGDPMTACFLYTWRLETPAFVSQAFAVLADVAAPATRRQAAAYYLMRVKPIDKAAALVALLADEEPRVVANIARGLGALLHADAVGPLVATYLGNSDRGVRINVLRALGALKRRGGVVAIMAAMKTDDAHLRRTALEALTGIAEDAALEDQDRRGLAALCRAVLGGDPVEDVRAAAVVPLGRLDPEAFAALHASVRLQGSREVRGAYAQTLGNAKVVDLARLDGFLRDPDRRVVALAAEAVGKAKVASARDRLRRLIGATVDEAVIATALEALTAVDSVDAEERERMSETAVLAYAKLPVGDNECKLNALKLALKSGKERASPFFTDVAAADPEWPVREAARAALRELGSNEPADRHLPAPSAEREALVAELTAKAAVTARIRTERGEIVARLHVKEAPYTVANFVALARQGFYDGVLWHRVVPDFVAQAGCPRGDGWGGPGASIRCEINEFTYRRGALGMALAGKDTGGSQWFFCLADQPHLDGRYTLFGQIESGYAALDRLVQGDRIDSIVIE